MKPARIFLFTILYVSLTFLYTSCVREDTGDCIQYVLDMQAVDSEGNDLTATDALQKSGSLSIQRERIYKENTHRYFI